MGKLASIMLAATIALVSVAPGHERFANYKSIEAYEVRPGVMVLPRYAADGAVCEIGIQKSQYTPDTIVLDPELSRKEIDEIFDELVPSQEQGPRSKDFPGDMVSEVGPTLDTIRVFQNVTLGISSEVVQRSRLHGITISEKVATIHWNNRKCQ